MEKTFRDETLYDVTYDKERGLKIGSVVNYNGIDYYSPPDGECFKNTILMLCYAENQYPEAAHQLSALLDSQMVGNGHDKKFIERVALKARVPVMTLK